MTYHYIMIRSLSFLISVSSSHSLIPHSSLVIGDSIIIIIGSGSYGHSIHLIYSFYFWPMIVYSVSSFLSFYINQGCLHNCIRSCYQLQVRTYLFPLCIYIHVGYDRVSGGCDRVVVVCLLFLSIFYHFTIHILSPYCFLLLVF